ncbi:aspartate carbamoyltransferase [Candidatus Hydrogenisulfobacillus filiaventi]|uniref:Aspartate carbamoyltransferase n=1 Tax=Candidatus Hydrogenisulfobacillus filiaventi TaxID=2707344 RepID=A0A6F8ZFW7_9FIRM|nr:aspartate carbamoyltransferase catalytic subunit [Bacillota bacterium]CAB1128489.1 aspartate carbamoyltransferase [Candidatus Hydrogenisulfobacillus filiaventi]
MNDLLGLADLSAREITELLDLSQELAGILERPIKKVPTLRGTAVATLFFEPSTRTRTSFELAAKYLSADTVNLSPQGSSLEKGETLWDTARTVAAMGVDALVVRHRTAGVPERLAALLPVPVINAGDGAHEHPTQGLLDLLTVRQHFGRIAGLKVAVVGDLAHSRVARSDLWGFTALGAEVRLVGPRLFWPADWEELGVPVTEDLEAGIRGCQVVQVLRLQRERQAAGLIPDAQEYFARWGLTPQRLARLAPEAVVLHPGPMNRGVEIASPLADGPASLVARQVTNGVAVRMAVLYRLLGGRAR